MRSWAKTSFSFATGEGRAGLLYPRCMHRGTSLYYGQVEHRRHPLLLPRLAVRCGRDTASTSPASPSGGRIAIDVRQPWYPVQERYGLVFAYLGPPERLPLLPRYDILEDARRPDESAVVHVGGFG